MLSKSLRAQIGILILATSIIQLANGFFGTFISLRVAMEDFGPTASGLVLSSYFAGFTLGALRCERIIERVGHIRAYAAFAGMVVAATTAMPLLPGPLLWFILRAVIGFGCSGLFIATESWLNAKAETTERGRIFSVYMLGTFLGLALGQLLIGQAKVETAEPFNVIAVLFAVALVIVSTTRAEPPRRTASTPLPFGRERRDFGIAQTAIVFELAAAGIGEPGWHGSGDHLLANRFRPWASFGVSSQRHWRHLAFAMTLLAAVLQDGEHVAIKGRRLCRRLASGEGASRAPEENEE